MTQTKARHVRPTYATVHLDRFGANIETARKLAGTDIIAVIKANGYGHGAAELARHARRVHGVTRFGVATVAEGMELGNILDDAAEIYCFGFIDPEFYPETVEAGLVPTMFDHDIAESFHAYLEKTDRTARVSVKLDTGMHRLGFSPNLDLPAFRERYPRFDVIHIMSHLASADADRDYTLSQIEAFDAWTQAMNPGASVSMLNSSGIVGYDNTFSLARPGIMLYGYVDTDGKAPDLAGVMSIASKVVHVLELEKGMSVSYGRKFTAETDMTIGVIPMGYADGYPRCFTNRAHMMLGDVKCPVVGTVCMDMVMIDITAVPEGRRHEPVEVMGDRIGADAWAEWAGTISYEVLCGISPRIPRIYAGGAGG